MVYSFYNFVSMTLLIIHPFHAFIFSSFNCFSSSSVGIGLAAPQVGINKRLMVFNDNMLESQTCFMQPAL